MASVGVRSRAVEDIKMLRHQNLMSNIFSIREEMRRLLFARTIYTPSACSVARASIAYVDLTQSAFMGKT